MGKMFRRAEAGEVILAQVSELIRQYHPALEKAGVRVDVLEVTRDEEPKQGEMPKPVLKLHGVPCLALAKLVSARERAKGGGDAEIQVDVAAYDGMTVEQQRALLDHELTHFELKLKDGQAARDAGGRPKLSIRPHDYDFGWFDAVALRHREHSGEVRQAKDLLADAQGWLPLG